MYICGGRYLSTSSDYINLVYNPRLNVFISRTVVSIHVLSQGILANTLGVLRKSQELCQETIPMSLLSETKGPPTNP